MTAAFKLSLCLSCSSNKVTNTVASRVKARTNENEKHKQKGNTLQITNVQKGNTLQISKQVQKENAANR